MMIIRVTIKGISELPSVAHKEAKKLDFDYAYIVHDVDRADLEINYRLGTIEVYQAYYGFGSN